MRRAIVSKTIIDSLIRAKLGALDCCKEVEALPVAASVVSGNACNWTVPGWLGDVRKVKDCSERMAHYVSFLQAQFDIPPEPPAPPQP